MELSGRYLDRSEHSMKLFLKDISKIDVLEHEQENELFRQLKEEDLSVEERQAIINHIMLGHQRFIISFIKEFNLPKDGTLSRNDLINEANIGMRKAIEKYDYTRGFKFISYAVWDMQAQIIDFLKKNNVIRIPENKITLHNTILDTIDRLQGKYFRPPTLHEIAEEIKVSPSKVEETLQDMQMFRHQSLDEDIRDNKNQMNGKQKIDFIPSYEPLPDTSLIQSQTQSAVLYMIDQSLNDDRYKRIVKSYYGIGCEADNLCVIAEKEGISPERVRQIIEKSKSKMKKNARSLYNS